MAEKRIAFKYAVPVVCDGVRIGWNYYTKKAVIDWPLCEDGFSLDHDKFQQNIMEYIRNELNVKNFKLIWFEAIAH